MQPSPAIAMTPQRDDAPDHRPGAGYTLALALIAVLEECGAALAELPASAPAHRRRRRRAIRPR